MPEIPKSAPLPLTALRSFEALARRLDMDAAGAELNVTASAVMHQVRQLEETLGRKLIQRDRTTFVLTPAGRILFATTNRAMTLLRQGLAEARMQNPAGALNVLILKEVNHPFIRDRINAFITANSTVSVNVTTDPVIDAELIESYGAVFCGSGFSSDMFTFRRIHTEELEPHCRPDCLRTLRDAATPTRLLSVEGEEAERDLMLMALRAAGIETVNIITFPARRDAALAAVDGVGVAMIDRNLYQEQIIDGVLVPALPGVAPNVRDCFLAIRKSIAEDRVLRDFSALFPG